MFASRSIHNRINKKAIAICIAMAFLFNTALQDLAWAYEEPNNILSGSSMGGGAGPGQLKSDLDSLGLPLSLGSVKKIYSAETERPTVIYIQDAHCNYSCQKSIEGIIGYFNKNYGVKLAVVEGSAGDHNYSIFTSIPDIDLREKILNYFIREGRVTGVDSFASLNPDKLVVKGLEEPELYEKNLNVYKESLTFKDTVNKYLKILRHFIENLKSPIFSNKIKELDEKKTIYDDSKNKLKDYIIYLGEISRTDNIRINKFQNLSKLLKLIEEEEEVNFKKAEKEREALLELLTRKLSKIEIASLVEKSIEFKKGDMSASDFHEYFFTKAGSCNIDMSKYPSLLKYKAYLDKYDNLEKDVFFEEIFDAERYIADNLFRADDERRLFYLSDDLSILNKLFSVSLTRRLYDYYRQKKDELKTSKFIKFIKEKASWYNMPTSINPEVERLDVYRDKIGNFYQYSFERDEVFIKNLDKYSRGEEAIFMVTGGFHTENIIDLLKKNGYSYVLITPKLISQKDNPYFHLLAGSLSPIESILNEYTAALALRNPFGLIGEERIRQYISLTVHRLREFIPRAAEEGWIHSVPYRVAPGVFMTLSLRPPEEILSADQLPDVIETREAGNIEIARGKPQPLYAIVHRSEELFGKPRTDAEIIQRQTERALEAITPITPVVEASTALKPEVRDVVLISFITTEAESPLAAEGSRLERKIRKDYGSETEVERYQAGVENEMDNFLKGFESILERWLTGDVLEQIINGQIPPYSLQIDVFAPGREGVDEAWRRIDSRLKRFYEARGEALPEAERLEQIKGLVKDRIHIIDTQIPPDRHINEAAHVVWAKSINNILRYKAGEYGTVETDFIETLESGNIRLLKTIVSNPDDINAALIYKIIEGLEPLRSLGVAETIQQMRENYESIIRSL